MQHIIMPSEKSEEMEAAIKRMFGVDRRASILSKTCASCGGDAINFRDGLSRREFAISGLCQECQDKIFPLDPFLED
jgi:hypothetical protein